MPYALLLALTAADPAVPIAAFDRPFLFAYGTWDRKVVVADGHAVLAGPGVTPKGGAGRNVTLDLARFADRSPVMAVTVGAGNTAKSLRLMLKDAGGRSGVWKFSLPAAPGPATLVPEGGAPLSAPNETEKGGPPDLAKLTQWQLMGDWGGDGPLAVTVTAVTAAEPDERVTRLRAAAGRKAKEDRDRKDRERAELVKRYARRGPDSPAVTHVSAAGPDVLSVTVEAGRITPGKLEEYTAQPGDKAEKDGAATVLNRGGKRVGWLVGPKKDTLVHFERFAGDPLLDFLADDPATFAVRSADDPAFAEPTRPAAVGRKSRPIDWAQPGSDFVLRHTLYLRLPKPLTPGKTYSVAFGPLNTREPEAALRFDPAAVRSEAVHVSQIGFRSDDPVKEGRLSVWLGTAGAYPFPDGLTFRLVDDATGTTAFAGKVEPHWPADRPERLAREENFAKTGVWRMNFSDFRTPGRYRLVADGVGCSHPFEVGPGVWERAFVTQMRGLYHNRSGVELAPPLSDFRKPRDFHPADGAAVVRSRFSVPPGASEHDLQAGLVKEATGEPTAEAWGGYHDAGDWQPRRATHLRVTMAQLEVLDLFPDAFRKLSWPLPKSSNAPAVLDEALWELDLFRRLQRPDGGVPYGIETKGDPAAGEVSWKQSLTAYVAAPDVWSSVIYAAAAARAGRLLAPTDPDLAAAYRESALKAMAWAEAEWPKGKRRHWETGDDRNLAALELYRLTGDSRWHDLFKATTCLTDAEPKLFAWGKHVQIDAAFWCAKLPAERADAALQAKAKVALAKLADVAVAYSEGNAFGLAHHDPGRPMFLGFFSTPMAGPVLCKAHALTGDARYLAAAVRSAQFAAGCNPHNGTYTTGLGANPPKNPLKLDARRTGQPAPAGLTVYGNVDYWKWRGGFWDWPITWHLSRVCKPDPYEWPLPEAFFDVFLYPAMTEYTVDVWAPNVATWGYLAARP